MQIALTTRGGGISPLQAFIQHPRSSALRDEADVGEDMTGRGGEGDGGRARVPGEVDWAG